MKIIIEVNPDIDCETVQGWINDMKDEEWIKNIYIEPCEYCNCPNREVNNG